MRHLLHEMTLTADTTRENNSFIAIEANADGSQSLSWKRVRYVALSVWSAADPSTKTSTAAGQGLHRKLFVCADKTSSGHPPTRKTIINTSLYCSSPQDAHACNHVTRRSHISHRDILLTSSLRFAYTTFVSAKHSPAVSSNALGKDSLVPSSSLSALYSTRSTFDRVSS